MNETSDSRPETDSPVAWQGYWKKEQQAAEKRLVKFRQQGNRVIERYRAQYPGDDDYTTGTSNYNVGLKGFQLNFFHKNIKTVSAMMMGSTPKIDVSREFQDPDDDVARVAAVLYQRMLQTDVEVSGSDEPFVLKQCLQDRLLPGLGVARVRYTIETEQIPDPDFPDDPEMMLTRIVDESADMEYVAWRDFRWGWARTWKEVPWIAFRAYLSKDAAIKRFGEKAQSLEYKQQTPNSNDGTDNTLDANQKSNEQKAEVWEIWDKRRKKVFWWSKGAEAILDEKDDPLQLEGFWPMPRPLMANLTTTLLMPKADYIFAQDLYNEIDELGTRIANITRAIKVVGVYDQSAGDSVGRMMEEGLENDMIPVDNWDMFAEKGGLRGTVDWFPVQDIVGVLQTLKGSLSETIELLYEVTGLSDIMRGGNTDQYTAASTNELKAKFGSIEIQSFQDEYARFCSELESIKAEVISKHFMPESIEKQSNARFLPQADQQLIQPAIALMKSQDLRWRVKIQPESIAITDFAQLRNERTEFLNTMATYIQSAQAAAKSIPGSLPVMLEFIKYAMAGFRGANDMEGILDSAIDQAMQAAQQPQQGENPQQAAIQAEQMKQQTLQIQHQNKMREISAKNQSDIQLEIVKTKSRIAEMQYDAQFDQSTEQVQHRNALIQAQEAHLQSLEETRASMMADLSVENRQAENDMLVDDHETANKLTLIQAQAMQSGGNE